MTIWGVLGLVGLAVIFIFVFARMGDQQKRKTRFSNTDGDTSWWSFGGGGGKDAPDGGSGHGGDGGGD